MIDEPTGERRLPRRSAPMHAPLPREESDTSALPLLTPPVVGRVAPGSNNVARLDDVQELLVQRGVRPDLAQTLRPGSRELAAAVAIHEQGGTAADIEAAVRAARTAR